MGSRSRVLWRGVRAGSNGRRERAVCKGGSQPDQRNMRKKLNPMMRKPPAKKGRARTLLVFAPVDALENDTLPRPTVKTGPEDMPLVFQAFGRISVGSTATWMSFDRILLSRTLDLKSMTLCSARSYRRVHLSLRNVFGAHLRKGTEGAKNVGPSQADGA